MKSAFILPFITALAAAQDYAPFIVTNVESDQPSGAADGQTDYWGFSAHITSTNGNPTSSAYCSVGWSDNPKNCGNNCVPYSTEVPTGSWITCYKSQSDDSASNFAFMLYPMFAIGNYSVSFQENITDSSTPAGGVTVLESDPYHIQNTTSNYTCYIIGSESSNEGGTHAFGNCNTPQNFTGFSVPVATTEEAFPTSNGTAPTSNSTAPTTNGTSPPISQCDTSIALSFPVFQVTAWYDHVFVVGSIPELGNWSPYDAVALNADSYDYYSPTCNGPCNYPLWTGGNAVVEAGTSFEYKYIEWTANGTLEWECGENRVATVPEDACYFYTVGNNPDYFRCGNH